MPNTIEDYTKERGDTEFPGNWVIEYGTLWTPVEIRSGDHLYLNTIDKSYIASSAGSCHRDFPLLKYLGLCISAKDGGDFPFIVVALLKP